MSSPIILPAPSTLEPIDRRIRPSSLEPLEFCPGRAAAEAAVVDRLPPPPASPHAARGTLLHAAKAAVLDGTPLPPVAAADLPQLQSSLAFAGRLIQAYPDAAVAAETPVHMAHLGIPRGGTIDLRLDQPRTGTVVVADDKYGYQDVGPVSQHRQMQSYTVASMDQLGRREGHMFIHQTQRDGSVGLITADTKPVIEAEIRGITERARAPQAPLRPNLTSCQYCEAIAHCPAADRILRQVVNPTAAGDSSVTADRWLIAQKVIEARTDEARQRLQQGQAITGFKLGKPTERATIDAEQAPQIHRAFANDQHGPAFWAKVKVNGNALLQGDLPPQVLELLAPAWERSPGATVFERDPRAGERRRDLGVTPTGALPQLPNSPDDRGAWLALAKQADKALEAQRSEHKAAAIAQPQAALPQHWQLREGSERVGVRADAAAQVLPAAFALIEGTPHERTWWSAISLPVAVRDAATTSAEREAVAAATRTTTTQSLLADRPKGKE